MVDEFSARIAETMQPFFDYLPLMDTIPGVALRVSEDIIGVGHSILKIIYYVMRDRVSYEELGEDFFDRLNFTRLRNYYVNRLMRLGYEVILSEAAQVA